MKQHQKKIIIVGASGALGSALCKHYGNLSYDVYALSRTKRDGLSHEFLIDIENEGSIQKASKALLSHAPVQKLIIATGMLHSKNILPEKSFWDLSSKNMQKLYAVNTMGPALIIKYFLPLMDAKKPSVIAVISDSIGSIQLNQLGGWHSYRASKSALNMLIKNASIELSSTHKKLIVVGLHPGVVKSNLSAPYNGLLPKNEVFSPEFSSCQLIEVIKKLTPSDSGKIITWNGRILPF